MIGVWFYEEEEARKVAVLLHQIIDQDRAVSFSATITSEICLIQWGLMEDEFFYVMKES